MMRLLQIPALCLASLLVSCESPNEPSPPETGNLLLPATETLALLGVSGVSVKYQPTEYSPKAISLQKWKFNAHGNPCRVLTRRPRQPQDLQILEYLPDGRLHTLESPNQDSRVTFRYPTDTHLVIKTWYNTRTGDSARTLILREGQTTWNIFHDPSGEPWFTVRNGKTPLATAVIRPAGEPRQFGRQKITWLTQSGGLPVKAILTRGDQVTDTLFYDWEFRQDQ